MTWSRDDKLEIYAALIAAVPNLDLKGKTVRYTSMNGNMFSFLSKDGELAFRLGSVDREAFLERYPDAVVEQYGSVMKDYVAITDPVLDDDTELTRLFATSVANARTLQAKPTKRR